MLTLWSPSRAGLRRVFLFGVDLMAHYRPELKSEVADLIFGSGKDFRKKE
jgi:hypothetical protein